MTLSSLNGIMPKSFSNFATLSSFKPENINSGLPPSTLTKKTNTSSLPTSLTTKPKPLKAKTTKKSTVTKKKSPSNSKKELSFSSLSSFKDLMQLEDIDETTQIVKKQTSVKVKQSQRSKTITNKPSESSSHRQSQKIKQQLNESKQQPSYQQNVNTYSYPSQPIIPPQYSNYQNVPPSYQYQQMYQPPYYQQLPQQPTSGNSYFNYLNTPSQQQPVQIPYSQQPPIFYQPQTTPITQPKVKEERIFNKPYQSQDKKPHKRIESNSTTRKRANEVLEQNEQLFIKKNKVNKQFDFSLYEDKGPVSKRDKNKNLIGTSQALEKSYFRLKGEARSEDVRPKHVLKKSLKFVLSKFHKENDYDYVCDQLKAIRQDLTLQHINDDFTIQVYTIHSEISIQNEDISEFMQCASTLRKLFKLQRLPPTNDKLLMYTAYTILFNIDSKNVTSTASYSQIIEIPHEALTHPDISFVLQVKKAYNSSNYYEYFRLYTQANPFHKIIMKSSLSKVRLRSIMSLLYSRIYLYIVFDHQFLLTIIKKLLFFDTDEECIAFNQQNNIILDSNNNILCEETIKKLTSSD
ncbi:Leukocyte receptor cluster member [Entamoeba marina]